MITGTLHEKIVEYDDYSSNLTRTNTIENTYLRNFNK